MFVSVEAIRCKATLTLSTVKGGAQEICASFRCGRNKTPYAVVDYSEEMGGGEEAGGGGDVRT